MDLFFLLKASKLKVYIKTLEHEEKELVSRIIIKR